MRGEWFDSVSCCVTFSRSAVAEKPEAVRDFRHTLVRLMSLCHGSALEEIGGEHSHKFDTIDALGLDKFTLRHLRECKEVYHFNRVEVLLHMTQTLITWALDEGILNISPPILSRVYQTLSRGFVNLLNAKKITDTRFPFPYAQLLATLIIMHTMVTPLLLSVLIRSKIWAPLFTFVPVFGMCSLNFISSELEHPFGNDDNDLPLENFQSEMNTCLLMLLHDNSDLLPAPSRRCEMDFRTLKENMRLNETMGHAATGRFVDEVLADPSNFESEIGHFDSLQSKEALRSKEALSEALSITISTRRENFENFENLIEAEVPRRENVVEAEQPLPPLPSRRSESDEPPRSSRWSTQRGRTAAAIPVVAEALEKANIIQEMEASMAPILAKSMDDFNDALQHWTRTLEKQVAELSRNVESMEKACCSTALDPSCGRRHSSSCRTQCYLCKSYMGDHHSFEPKSRQEEPRVLREELRWAGLANHETSTFG